MQVFWLLLSCSPTSYISSGQLCLPYQKSLATLTTNHLVQLSDQLSLGWLSLSQRLSTLQASQRKRKLLQELMETIWQLNSISHWWKAMMTTRSKWLTRTQSEEEQYQHKRCTCSLSQLQRFSSNCFWSLQQSTMRWSWPTGAQPPYLMDPLTSSKKTTRAIVFS